MCSLVNNTYIYSRAGIVQSIQQPDYQDDRENGGLISDIRRIFVSSVQHPDQM
jgi:hypothetical protein